MEFDINKVVFEKTTLSYIDELLHIIHRCVKEVNSKDYDPVRLKSF